MVIASLAGFGAAAWFINVQGVELPYYITLIGAGTLKICSPRDQLFPRWD